MPAAPELGDGLGDVGVVEVLGELEAQHPAQADGHLGITGKVEIDLEGKGQDPHPYHKDAAVRRKDGRDLRPQGAGLIGQQDLFSQAHHETADPQGKTLKAFGPGVQLRGNVLVADNGSGNELGEHGHIGSEAYDIVLGPELRPGIRRWCRTWSGTYKRRSQWEGPGPGEGSRFR